MYTLNPNANSGSIAKLNKQENALSVHWQFMYYPKSNALRFKTPKGEGNYFFIKKKKSWLSEQVVFVHH